MRKHLQFVFILFSTISFCQNKNEIVIDVNGNAYHTVKIGSQTWMVENLKVTKYRNGDPIQNVIDNVQWSKLKTGAFCYYNNDESNKTVYGAIYNWYAVSDKRNIAPSGWHIPSEVEWETLINYLGGWEVAGGKLKEQGLQHWKAPNTKADNISGFKGLPGGSRFWDDGSFQAFGTVGNYWSSTAFTEMGDDEAKNLDLYSESGEGSIGFQMQQLGMSVRCIKNNEGTNYSDINEFFKAFQKVILTKDKLKICEFVNFPFDEQGTKMSKEDFINNFNLSDDILAIIKKAISPNQYKPNHFTINGTGMGFSKHISGFWKWDDIYYGE